MMFTDKLRYWLPPIFWAGLIFYLSGIPNLKTDLGTLDLILRKLAHISEYAILTLLLLRAFSRTTELGWNRSRFHSAWTAAFYAISDEFHQKFVPTRGSSPLDVGIDCLGVILAIGISAWWLKRTGRGKGRGREKINFNSFFLYLFLYLYLFFPGCGVDYQWQKAKKLESKEDYPAAAIAYQKVVDKYPTFAYIEEAYYRLANIYRRQEKFPQARDTYKVLISSFTSGYWAAQAKEEIISCYDYFPLAEGNYWVEGDSESGGKYYRAEIRCEPTEEDKSAETYEHFVLIIKTYAGKRLIGKQSVGYLRTMKGISSGQGDFTVFPLPLVVGESWVSSQDGEKIRSAIISDHETVKVRAGQFTDCLKIKRQSLNNPTSWRFDYYAPQVGHILVTKASQNSNKETPSTELIEYRLKPE